MNIEKAEIIINEYGKLLSSAKPCLYGISLSTLPYEKEEIKVAIQTLILTIDKNDKNIHESLIQAYVYLAQFIADEKVEKARKGQVILEQQTSESKKENDINQNTDDLELANHAIQTINIIKSDMENLMNEIRLIVV